MEVAYDEDLNENSFFQVLQTEHNALLRKASTEGWIICVPRAGALPKYALSDEDFFSHILIPSDELPESHFRTLNDNEVKICNRLITVERNDISRPYSTHILFEETFYSDDLSKYKVLCIENPLERHADLSGQNDESKMVVVQTLRDCIDFLWTESAGKEVFERMDEAVHNFISVNSNLEFEPLQVQKDAVGALYTLCLQIALKDTRLREKSNMDKHLLENVKVSVETYMQHGIYKKLFKGITTCTAYEDAYLNKIVRNLSDVQLRDLEVRSDLYDTIPHAKRELARIECYSTVLGKIRCIKRMIAAISKPSGTAMDLMSSAIAADDLLPVIVFLIIKSGLPNWVAHLTYMKQFRFSSCNACHVDECSFLITTVEAAIEHIKTGVLYGPSAPEAQYVYEDSGAGADNEVNVITAAGGETNCIADFFEQVRLGSVEKVHEILSKKPVTGSVKASDTKTDFLHLCHPLCSCDKCESVLSRNLCDTKPTVHSCDDRGFTALHVACLFGRPLIVELLVSSGANVDASDYSGSTPLHYAAAKGHQNALLLLLHSRATIQVCDNDGNTPLHLACNNGHEGCMKALLYFAEHNGMKLELDCRNANGDTPLHHAARWGYESIVQILLEYGASPHVENRRHFTPLNNAHNLNISKLLTATKPASPSQTLSVATSGNKDSVDIAAVTRPNLDLSDDSTKSNEVSVKQDRKIHGIRPHSTEEIKKVERLLRAIAFGDTRLASYYLGLDGPPSSPAEEKVTSSAEMCHPLCTCEKCMPADALDNEDTSVEREVMNVNVCNSDGFTPLHVSAMHGRSEMVRLLLDAGAQPNVVTRTKGVTPLHLACQNQRVSVAKQLLQSGECDVDIQDSRGNTALHYASITCNSRLVELVLKYGPATDVKNLAGRTALEEAEEKMALSVARLLKGGKTGAALPWEEKNDV